MQHGHTIHDRLSILVTASSAQGRFHGSIEAEIGRHESLSAYAACYNEERLHRSPDIDRCETPLQAFGKRRATDAIRKSDPRWMERDTNDQAKQFPYTTSDPPKEHLLISIST